MRRAAWLIVLLALALPLASGCPASKPSPAPGYDLGPDGYIPPGVDTDADGLCDNTEVALGLDPLLPDTDADGYPDWFEITGGYQARVPSSPNRDELVVLSETADSTAMTSIVASVRGAGETFSGAFDPQIIRDAFGVNAGNFFVSASALGAEPPANVARIDAVSRTFENVRGRTLLFSDVRFAFGTQTALGCVRAYPLRYYTKTDTDRTVAIARRLLLVLPAGTTPATGPWCASTGPCW